MRMRLQYMVIIGGTRTKYRDPLYCHVLQMIIHCHISCTFHHIEVRKTRGFHVHLPFAPGRSQWLCACYIFHSTTDFTKMVFHLNLLQHLSDAAISPLQLRAVSPIPQQIISRSTLSHPSPEIIVNYHFICKFCAKTRITIILQNVQKKREEFLKWRNF